MPPSAPEVNELKQAHSDSRLLPAIAHRWSPRSFADRDVSPADLRTVFEAARWAASSNNEQPWRFFVGARGSETYNKILQSLVEFNQLWAKSAPVLILSAASTKFARNGSDNYHALHDLGAAAATLCYQATALGLFTHQMGGYDHDVARKLFNLPEDYAFGAAMALGYLEDPAALPNDKLLTQETTPRQRKSLEEIVFSDWNQPANLG